jgi:hypothetical protein
VTTKTITVKAFSLEENHRVGDLIQNLTDMNCINCVEGIESTGERGVFNVTFNSEQSKDKAIEALNLSEADFVTTDQTKEEQSMILEGIPMEYPKIAIIEYLLKYLNHPEVYDIRYKNSHIKTGQRKIVHKGIKRPIGRKIYVGPDIAAWVKAPSHLPLSMLELKCSKCLETGHLQFGCEEDPRCYRCRQTGHIGRDCTNKPDRYPTQQPQDKQPPQLKPKPIPQEEQPQPPTPQQQPKPTPNPQQQQQKSTPASQQQKPPPSTEQIHKPPPSTPEQPKPQSSPTPTPQHPQPSPSPTTQHQKPTTQPPQSSTSTQQQQPNQPTQTNKQPTAITSNLSDSWSSTEGGDLVIIESGESGEMEQEIENTKRKWEETTSPEPDQKSDQRPFTEVTSQTKKRAHKSSQLSEKMLALKNSFESLTNIND